MTHLLTNTMTSLLDLPLEILNFIVDLLCGEREALKNCCLVPKSLIPQARKHLFSNVSIMNRRGLQWWSRTFPDSPNSPAHHTRSLFIRCAEVLTTDDAKEDSWIQSFTNVVSLRVRWGIWEDSTPDSSFVPLHSLSSVKSLWIRVSLTQIRSSEVIKLLCALPLLKDLDTTQLDKQSTIPTSVGSAYSTSPRPHRTEPLCSNYVG